MVFTVQALVSRSFATVIVAAWLTQPASAAEVPCLILPYVEVSVVSPTEGLIETVAVERGDVVKKGQVLVMLEASREKAQR